MNIIDFTDLIGAVNEISSIITNLTDTHPDYWVQVSYQQVSLAGTKHTKK
jgi:hypothetical protein